jgi:hypothetical protein
MQKNREDYKDSVGMVSDEALKEFKTLYKEEFGTEISDKEALDLAINLLTMMNVVYRPIKKEWVKELENKNGTGTKNEKPA